MHSIYEKSIHCKFIFYTRFELELIVVSDEGDFLCISIPNIYFLFCLLSIVIVHIS